MDIQNENVTSNFWSSKEKSDYVDNLFLMESPMPMLLIWLSYLLFVLKIGPEYMNRRPAFTLNRVLIVYNCVQVLLSAYIMYICILVLHPVKYIFLSCANDVKTMQTVANTMHAYFLSKVAELLDTVFIVLRKKDRQVSFLHVYHHGIMIMFAWILVKFEPSESSVFSMLINSFIHIIMYAYYGLSAFPPLSKYLWWKKYITKMQLIQFTVISIHLIGHFIFGKCQPPTLILYLILFITVSLTFLFTNFYIKSYVKTAKKIKETKETLNREEIKKIE